jgi:hypothetical protein
MPYIDMQGKCPMGCGRTLHYSSGSGFVVCMNKDCPDDGAVNKLLADPEAGHIVVLNEFDFDLKHPLRERIDDELFDCHVYRVLTAAKAPPQALGRWRVTDTTGDDPKAWTWERVAET